MCGIQQSRITYVFSLESQNLKLWKDFSWGDEDEEIQEVTLPPLQLHRK